MQELQLAELERLRLGHEIHDSVIPYLFASSAGIKKLTKQIRDRGDSAQQVELIEQLGRWVEAAMTQSRSLLTNLYPPELENLSWCLAAQTTLSKLMSPTQYATIRWDIDDAVTNIPQPVALAGYRIVVEACRNAVAHGEANEIAVTCERSNHQLRATIQDNGSGFEPGQVAMGHYGLAAMKSRASLVGGQLDVNSKPGGPTRVRFIHPAQ